MARAPFQVIVIPFVKASSGEPRYGVFKRRTHEMWQAISGGGEDAETPLDAAKRETFEEAGIADRDDWVCLQSRASIPASLFSGTDHWAPDLYVVPEYAFGLAVADTNVELSPEHSECAWLPFQEAHQRLTWDSNRVALWELHCRIQGLPPRETPRPAVTRRSEAAGTSAVDHPVTVTRDQNVTFLISHHALIDGFGELTASRVYVPFETFCGICDAPFVIHPRAQKYLLEVQRIPVKMLQRGAVFCVGCRRRRSRINWLHRHDRWRSVPGGAEERDRLRSEESQARARSRRRYETALWPYALPDG